MLRHLCGHPILLLTNGPSGIQRAKIRALGLEDPFQGVFISEEVGTRKPDPAFFGAIEAAGFRRSEIVFFGDNPIADMDGGKRAGMTVVWINRDGRTYPQGILPPDHEGMGLLEGLTGFVPKGLQVGCKGPNDAVYREGVSKETPSASRRATQLRRDHMRAFCVPLSNFRISSSPAAGFA